MHAEKQDLQRLAEDIFTLGNPGELRDATIRLHELCSRVSGLRDDAPTTADLHESRLPAGVAISPLDAARCTLDYARTSKFLRGLRRAVLTAQERFPARRIEVLYAGCGPFAPLAIPLMTQFLPDELRFTLLDIHERSLDSARLLVNYFGLGDHVRDYVLADATKYVHPDGEPLHIVVTETMQRALTKEPQVEVTLQLAPQLCAGGILIPEKITVDACLYDPAREFRLSGDDAVGQEVVMPERLRITVGQLLELDMAGALRLRREGFPAVHVDLPSPNARPLEMMLRTQVTVFGSIVLGDYESGITYPHPIDDTALREPGTVIQYETGGMPGFRIRHPRDAGSVAVLDGVADIAVGEGDPAIFHEDAV